MRHKETSSPEALEVKVDGITEQLNQHEAECRASGLRVADRLRDIEGKQNRIIGSLNTVNWFMGSGFVAGIALYVVEKVL